MKVKVVHFDRTKFFQKSHNAKTTRERLKSAPYLRLKKRKTLFLEKIFFFQKKSQSAEKCKRRTLLDLLTYIPLQNIKKLKGGTLWGQKKFSKKKSHSAEKHSKGGPYSLVLFCILR